MVIPFALAYFASRIVFPNYTEGEGEEFAINACIAGSAFWISREIWHDIQSIGHDSLIYQFNVILLTFTVFIMPFAARWNWNKFTK
ncbi:MAG: hypothetical protein COA43_10550 [Robiginitomaculum sp.]|nr:MAG: hypothetical protein COA43_10550 [Robiginitomaculum sp.]